MCEQSRSGIALPLFFNPSFLWRFSEPCFDAYIHRYHRNLVYIHYKDQTDGGTSTLIDVIIISRTTPIHYSVVITTPFVIDWFLR